MQLQCIRMQNLTRSGRMQHIYVFIYPFIYWYVAPGHCIYIQVIWGSMTIQTSFEVLTDGLRISWCKFQMLTCGGAVSPTNKHCSASNCTFILQKQTYIFNKLRTVKWGKYLAKTITSVSENNLSIERSHLLTGLTLA